jgi:D-glycero-D-manno-heptose 1,7-bisphosphate phosphatase
MKRPAIFLDRDGTIIQDVGYIKTPQAVEFFPETIASLLQLQEYFLLFIITNQSGISKGITTENEVMLVNDFIVSALKSKGIIISEVYCCPHDHSDRCDCKKPNPYFIHQAEKSFQLDLSKSYLIGDHPSDVECGLNATITPIYVLTGHGEKHRDELVSECLICEDIAAASALIQTKLQINQIEQQ